MSVKDMFLNKALTKPEKKLYAREDLIYNVTEDILILLEDMDISKKDLAAGMGKSKSFATQILSGARNMTLGTLSDICFTLGVTPKITIDQSTQKGVVLKNSGVHWKPDGLELNRLQVIVTAENVYNFQDGKKWQKEVA